MKSYYGHLNEMGDKELNQIYTLLKSGLTPDIMKDVKAEQLKWIEEKEKKAEDERLEYNGGTFEDVAWYISLSMPLVIGMSATIERFNKLIADVDSSTHRTIISVDDVRGSGLLKDKIVITYPDEDIQNKDMAILQAATDEWKSKWDHWHQYCAEQHYSHVNPMFLIQVENRTGNRISKTDLDASIETIES